MEIYPILNKPGKGKYVFIFILNERAVLPILKIKHAILIFPILLLTFARHNNNAFQHTHSDRPQAPHAGVDRRCSIFYKTIRNQRIPHNARRQHSMPGTVF